MFPVRRLIIERTPRRRDAGQALVQTLVTIAVTSAILMVFLMMSDNQRRSSRQLQEKLAVMDLQRVLTNSLADGSVCTYLVSAAGLPTFNPTKFNVPGEGLVDLPSIPSRAVADALPAVVADGQTPVSPISASVVSSSIRIDDLTCSPAPCSPSTSRYTANITINFDQRRTIVPLKPLKFPISLASSGGAGAQTISSCQGQAVLDTLVRLSAVESCGGDPTNWGCPFYPVQATVTCPSGYQVTGCGYTVSKWPSDGYFHSNGPDHIGQFGPNGCDVYAGGAPGCGVCFQSQAFCVKVK